MRFDATGEPFSGGTDLHTAGNGSIMRLAPVSTRYCPVPGYWDQKPLCPEIDEIAAGSFKHRQPPQIKGSGCVVKSLEAALWAFYHGEDFRSGALMAVNLGDDAGTTGAVHGQVAGVFYGAEGVPAAWLDRLCMRELIEKMAARLAANP